MAKITFTISKTGTDIIAEVHGVKGHKCAALTEPFLRNIANKRQVNKPEFYKEHSTHILEHEIADT